jgi:hypothetical protein
MKIKKYFLLILFQLGLVIFIQAQDSYIKHFDKRKAHTFQNNLSTSNKHIIKINPLAFARGDIPLFYETTRNGRLGIEASIGVTIKDYIGDTYTTILEEIEEIDEFGTNTNRYDKLNKPGYSFRVGLRYYAIDHGGIPEGLYFGLNYRNQTYRSKLTSYNGIETNKMLINTYNDAFLSFGWLILLDKNVYIDPYIGLGLRNRSRYDLEPTENEWYQVEMNNDIVPLVLVGLKLGIVLN